MAACFFAASVDVAIDVEHPALGDDHGHVDRMAHHPEKDAIARLFLCRRHFNPISPVCFHERGEGGAIGVCFETDAVVCRDHLAELLAEDRDQQSPAIQAVPIAPTRFEWQADVVGGAIRYRLRHCRVHSRTKIGLARQPAICCLELIFGDC
ncbi:MAG: hypothetical protein KIT00_09075 [Rhodospirillales bacterium]|nr:hypothetical protein [Rhodospirillales bacterium]